MKEQIFCCDNFESGYRLPNQTHPNFRVLKTYPKFSDNPLKKFSYLITLGYTKFTIKTIFLNIHFCPFCGQDLASFYDSDDFVNIVEEDDFFGLK